LSSAGGPALRQVLDNGLTVLVHPTTHAPVATLWVWYRVGSRNEPRGQTGISHWVEHMLFKGTPRYPRGEIDRRVAREGGTFNGMTWLDWTTYFATLPADRIGLALDIEADRMVHALIAPDEVDSERTVILSEREGQENSPLFLLGEAVQATALQHHPYRHEVIGLREDLLGLTRDDLYAHYRRYYHPANAVVVAVGAFEPEAMLAQVAAAFGPIPAGAPSTTVTVAEPEQVAERRVTVRGDDATAFVAAAWPAPAATDADYFAFQVLDTVLGGAKSMNVFGDNPPNLSSRLYRSLVDSGQASSVSSGLAATLDPFLFSISAVVQTEADPAAVEAGLLAEVARLRDEPVDGAALARAVKQTRAQFAYSAESVTDQGFWLGFAEVVADQAWLAETLERLAAVTPADVQRVAAHWLDDTRRTLGHYIPSGTAAQDDEDPDEADDADFDD
jgi:zinc protease